METCRFRSEAGFTELGEFTELTLFRLWVWVCGWVCRLELLLRTSGILCLLFVPLHPIPSHPMRLLFLPSSQRPWCTDAGCRTLGTARTSMSSPGRLMQLRLRWHFCRCFVHTLNRSCSRDKAIHACKALKIAIRVRPSHWHTDSLVLFLLHARGLSCYEQ
jgi:hypothetical protein